MSSCARHPHERGVSPCRRCGAAWCGDCLVYAFGGKKLPYCMSCAMYAGGVRTTPARPALSRREIKKLAKECKVDGKRGTSERVEAAASDGPQPGLAEVDTSAPSSHDWERPWWEDEQPTLVD